MGASLSYKLIKPIVLIGFFIHLEVNAQNQRVADSLLEATSFQSLNFEMLHQVAYNETNPQNALIYADRLVEISESDIENYMAYYSKGTAYRLMGNHDKALECFFLSAEYAKKYDHKSGLAIVNLAIGGIYSNNGDNAKSIKYCNVAIAALRTSSDSISLAGALLNTGYGYYLAEKFDSALLYYEEAGVIHKTKGYVIGEAYNLGNSGLIYAKQGKTALAEKKLQEAIVILTELEDSFAITEYQIEMAIIYRQKGNYQIAEKYLLEALSHAQQDALYERIRDASLELSLVYNSSKDFEKAYLYHVQHLAYRDSVNNDDVIRKLADLRTEFEVGQKQVEVDLLNQEAKTQRIVLWGVLVFLVLVFVLVFVLYKLYRLRNRAIKIAKKRRQVITSQRNELEELNKTKDKFFSIISHDIRAPVNNFQGVSQLIKMYVESGETQELIRIAKIMDKSSMELSTLLDNLLDWAMNQQGKFPYKQEDFSLTDICQSNMSMMENLASAKEIKFMKSLENEVFITADRNSVSTIIRNLLSNAIKFTPTFGQVSLSLEANDTQAIIEITDTGVGISKSKLKTLFGFKGERSRWGTAGEKGVGLGLNLVQEFVQMNLGEIKVESEEGKGSVFTVTLPLR